MPVSRAQTSCGPGPFWECDLSQRVRYCKSLSSRAEGGTRRRQKLSPFFVGISANCAHSRQLGRAPPYKTDFQYPPNAASPGPSLVAAAFSGDGPQHAGGRLSIPPDSSRSPGPQRRVASAAPCALAGKDAQRHRQSAVLRLEQGLERSGKHPLRDPAHERPHRPKIGPLTKNSQETSNRLPLVEAMSVGRIRKNNGALRDLARHIGDITDVKLSRALDGARFSREERQQIHPRC